MDVYVLGTPYLSIEGREVSFPAGRPGRLLASLLVARGRVVIDDRLVDDVWGDDPPADARAALHTTVNRARRALTADARRIERAAAGYRIDLTGVGVDADRFTSALARARGLDHVERLAAYDEALGWWRGPAWAGVTGDGVLGEAVRLAESHVAALEERAEVLLALGREREAVAGLRELVAQHPLRDRPALLLMRALHRVGASADALAVFTAHRTALADELGLDPSPELVEAQRDVLARTPGPAAAYPPQAAGQVADSATDTAFSPVRELVGRADDVAHLRDLLSRHRCVTVIGPGGVGKTSLAHTLATEESSWWVDLASVTTGGGVRAITASALEVEIFPGGSAEAALHRRLETATGVLVLDNCEHVLGEVADLVAEVVHAGAGIRVLATSRERLGLPEEQVYPLAPLRLPGPGGNAQDAPAVALFLQRATAASPDLEATPDVVRDVAELVRRLDGLPLAIELAASRVGVVSLATLRERLDHRLDLLRSHHRRGPARHQTLVDTIDWSYNLLDEDQRRAMRRLAVFAGPFDLDSAEAVLGPDATEQVLGLVERSLVVRPGATQDAGYRLLETVRAFARSMWDDAEREEIGLAHARWSARVAAEAHAGMSGPDVVAWIERIEAMLPELGRVMAWALETGRVEEAVRIVPDLYPFAYFRVRADVMGWGQRLLESAYLSNPSTAGPAVLAVASTYWWMVGDQERAGQLADRGIELAGGPGAADAYLPLNAAVDTALSVGALDKAWELASCARQLATDAGDLNGAALCASGMLLARTYDERDAADEIALLRGHQAGVDSPMVRAMVLYSEAEAVAATEPTEALRLFAEARELARHTGNRLALGVTMAAETALLDRVGALDASTLTKTADAVRFWLGSGNENLFVTCLRNVVSLLGRLGAHRDVVALVATTTTQTPDRPSYGVEAERLAEAMSQAREALGDTEVDAAWREGAARDLDAAAHAVIEVLGRQPPTATR